MNLQDLGIAPISEGQPAGEDVTYDGTYAQLSDEVKKLSSPSAAGEIDWKKVENLAAAILHEKSKHLLVACCLTIALHHTAGWRGFAQGTRILKDLLLTYWDDCFPTQKRMRGRRNAILWWQEQTEKLIQSSAGESWESAEYRSFFTDLQEIDAFLGEKMEEAPILRSMIQALGSCIAETITAEPKPEIEPDSAPAPETKPPPAAPPASRVTPSAAAPTRQAAPMTADAEVPPEKNFERGCDYLRVAATQYLHANPYHQTAYRINRVIAWFPLDRLPPATEGASMLPPPDSQLISGLKSLEQSADWQGLLAAAEAPVRQYLFWLDLSRYVATALKQLGQATTAEGVTQETLLLVRRLPGIEKLSFNDGTPFADPATREWLRESAKGAAPAGTGADSGDKGVQTQIDAACELARQNKATEALQQLRAGLRSCGVGREQLQWEMGICRVLCRQQQPALALPYAHLILEKIDQFHLEHWEPQLAETALEVVYQTLQIQPVEMVAPSKTEVLGRLALLNPTRAMDIG